MQNRIASDRYVRNRRGLVSSPSGLGNPTPTDRVRQVPHCAPLERGDWMCRAAIDISLLWSERQHTKIQGAASIVGARFPRPMGWGTQPLRVQVMVCHIRDSDKRTLRSSGALGLEVSRCYRHIAPLERKAPTHQNSRRGIHRRGEVSSPDGLGNPTPTNSMVG